MGRKKARAIAGFVLYSHLDANGYGFRRDSAVTRRKRDSA
jgi:hypothetical protein